MTEAARLAARLSRVDIYTKWLSDDVDGLTANLQSPEPLQHATAILADARERVALALGRLDMAIERDRASHKEHA